MQKPLMIFLLILLISLFCCVCTDAFIVNDDFTGGYSPSLYTYVNVSTNTTLLGTGGYILVNGTVSGTPNNLYLRTINSLSPTENGTVNITITTGQCGGSNSIISFGLTNNVLTPASGQWGGVQIRTFDAGCDWEFATNTSRLCSSAVAFSSGTHKVSIAVKRTSPTATQYLFYVDGSQFCNTTQNGNYNLTAAIIDYSGVGATYHTAQFDDLIFTNYNYSSQCPDKPRFPIYRQDSFSYFGAIENCWGLTPNDYSIYPSNGQLCYDPHANGNKPIDFHQSYQNNITSPVYIWSETFKYTPFNESTYVSHTIFLDDSTYNGHLAAQIFLEGDSVYAVKDTNNDTLIPVCLGCLHYGVQSNIRVRLFLAGQRAYSEMNYTSNKLETVRPATYSVVVDDAYSAYNIPFLFSNPGNYNVPGSVDFDSRGLRFCMDDYTLAATDYDFTNITQGEPFAKIGDRCGHDWECYTGLCSGNVCKKKGFGAACSNPSECISDKCLNGFCSRPSWWDYINNAKNNNAGDDVPTNNLLSMLISIALGAIIGGLVAYLTKAASWAGASGGLAFFMGMFFFAIVGWLSAWIIIAMVLFIIAFLGLIIFVFNPGG